MKTLIAVAGIILFFEGYVIINSKKGNAYDIEAARQKVFQYKQKSGIGCAINIAAFNLNDPANEIPLLDGWGNYKMHVTGGNDSANIYFQQGINMYYSFHIIEALASFEKSIKFDEDFAMGYWGKALAYGPNINDVGYAASPEAIIAVQTAKEKCTNCTHVEKALIGALEVRYSSDSTQTRPYLNRLYADAMKKVYHDFPNSADAAALYADALIVQHPWDLYDRYYQPKSWTPEIVQVLESVIKQFPDNPGASHYYIHAVEGSAQPGRGLEVAERLGKMMPSVAHLVHMPSHIYIRTGYYDKGVESNINAVKGYYNYSGRFPAANAGTFLYLVHNLHLQAACAQLDGRYAEALKISVAAQNSFDSNWMDDMSGGGYWPMYSQYVYMAPFFTQVRFGKWDDILNAAPIPASRTYANAMWHFARGMAQARKQNPTEATKELQHIKDSSASRTLQESPAAFNPGITAVNLAERVLQGIIAEEKGDLTQAVTILKEAVDMEEVMLYNEPKDWLLPVRQYLGTALIKAGKYAEAEKVFKEDLKVNPNNGWSYTGLATAFAKQGRKQDAASAEAHAKKALERSDIKIAAAVF